MCLGIPGEVTEIREESGLRFAKVRFGGISRAVCLEYVPEAQVGDFVVVHVGFALARVDREEAERTLALLAVLGGEGELEEGALGGEDPAPGEPGEGA